MTRNEGEGEASTGDRPRDAAAALVDATALFERARGHLAGRDVDAVQMEAYDLALCWAELRAAGVALDAVAAASSDETAFERQLARLFCAEAIANLRNRLGARPAVFGLDGAALGAAPFVGRALSPATLSGIGETLRQRQGRLPADGIDGDHALMRETFRRFAEEQVMPLAESIHRNDAMIPDAIIDGLRQLGCFGLSVPARHGGLQPDDADDSLGMVLVTEELSRGSLGAAGSLVTRPEIMARAVLEGGTEEQKQRWLRGLAAGEPLVAVAVTEPATGSDVASVALRAAPVEIDGVRHWRLSGAKTWCTFAGKAGAILLLARTNPDAKPPHRGLSLFVVEKPSTDGKAFVHRSPLGGTLTGSAIPTIGYRGMHSFELAFEDYMVPHGALVGEDAGMGRGFYYTMRGFAGGRLQTAARANGLMRAAFEAALRYAEERSVFGRPVADYPLTLQKLARMAAHIVACRQFCYAVAKRMDSAEGQLEASLAKLLACRAAEWVTREAMQIHGGMGYAEETAVSRYFVDARVLSIFEGAEETLALKVIGKALLG